MRTGMAEVPLHYGRAPAWLFQRMKRLAGAVAEALVLDEGTRGVLERLSDPYWFQAFGCILGFDWHSSGLTTTTCGALKEGLVGREEELGLFVAGGKGATSRKTPSEIEGWGERIGIEANPLVYASRTSAKVDSAAVQDGYQIYHHVFLFDRDGRWGVVQQGMNETNGMARRYHWLGERVEDFVCEPHAAVCCDVRGETLNLVARESKGARQGSTEVARQMPETTLAEIERLRSLALPRRHEVELADVNPKRLASILLKTYDAQPAGFEDLLGLAGVGAKTLRALSLLAELLYGSPRSTEDPARFSFAHGGKDGTPFPVQRAVYDRSIATLEKAIRSAKLGRADEIAAFKRLARTFTPSSEQDRSG